MLYMCMSICVSQSIKGPFELSLHCIVITRDAKIQFVETVMINVNLEKIDIIDFNRYNL